MQACLRNGCRSVTAIKFGIAHVPGFDSSLQAFLRELIDALLLQPYRGIMLRELDRFFAQEDQSIDFLALLSSAVDDQGESSLLKGLRSRLFTNHSPFIRSAFTSGQLLKLKRNSTSEGKVVRSMLGFSFKHQNARHIDLCDCVYTGDFEMRGIPRDKRPPKKVNYCRQPGEHFPNATRTPWLTGFTRFGSRSLPTVPDEEKCAIAAEYNNILGSVYEDDEHIGEVIVDLLGPRSRSGETSF